ncbi:SOS response-associated peptidase [Bifidobacterium pullorum]|uniref:SOS response-associated peptidase n=1 Tax=Bifidobacterium pullorum TaxID=78448 RepID=UPI0025A46B36|nr:SOS response-associated peptidase [Bifidobacterium pullorum]MDM8322048.1 SOS response-associated peptidase [Bifidobacterium pullorum]
MMCGRFAMPWTPDELADRLGLDMDDNAAEVMPSYNVGPGAIVAAVRADTDGSPTLTGARWSLIPAWSGTDRLPYPTFNARVESAADKPTFRDAARDGRILVPMLGYYEWDSHRRPHWFRMRDGRMLLAAGLLSIWRGIPTCTILTRRAEGRCAEIHDRMPVIIPPSRVQPWFDSGTDAQTALRDADRVGGGAVRLLASHPVAPLHGDGPGLIEPVAPAPEQGLLFD